MDPIRLWKAMGQLEHECHHRRSQRFLNDTLKIAAVLWLMGMCILFLGALLSKSLCLR